MSTFQTSKRCFECYWIVKAAWEVRRTLLFAGMISTQISKPCSSIWDRRQVSWMKYIRWWWQCLMISEFQDVSLVCGLEEGEVKAHKVINDKRVQRKFTHSIRLFVRWFSPRVPDISSPSCPAPAPPTPWLWCPRMSTSMTFQVWSLDNNVSWIAIFNVSLSQ